MALINCKECDKEISDKAEACPNCGAPAKNDPDKEEGRTPYSDHEVSVLLSQKKKTSHLLHLVLSILTAGVWVFVWFLVALSNASVNKKIDKDIKQGRS